jgi:hypothetical protein
MPSDMRFARSLSVALTVAATCGLSLPAVASADYSSAVLADDALAYYHLNEASGPLAADASGNVPAADGLYSLSGVSYSVPGAFPSTGGGTAVTLTTGTVNAVVPGTAHAASLWVRPSARAAQTFIEHGDPAGDGWAIGVAPASAPRGGKRKLLFRSQGVSVNSKISLAVGVWSMVSVSWDPASVSFHLNGGAISKTINTPAGWLAPGPALDSTLTVGPGAGAGGTSLDEVAVFPAALTKAQIAAHYSATLLPTVLSAPVLSPLPGVREGDTLTVTPASYSGATGSSREWQRCDTDGACSAIVGVADTTYTLTAADVDHTIQVQESASNANGSVSVISDATDPVLASPPVTTDPGTTTPPVSTDPGTTTPPVSLTGSGTTTPPATTTLPATCPGAPSLLAVRPRSARVGSGRVTLRVNSRRPRATLRAKRGTVRSVAFKWDGKRVRAPRRTPRTLIIRRAWMKPGEHVLKATVRPRRGTSRTIKMRLRVTRC